MHAPRERYKPKQRAFGLPKNQSTSASSDQVLNQDDYEQKYPADAYCEELEANARIYKVYTDEAAKHDDEAVDSWRDNLDVLLVFAGLFSAVVTTFVVETSNKLDVDFTKMNAHLLAESNAIQRALAAGIPLRNVPTSEMSPSMNFVPMRVDRWVNGLWFVSLAFSLNTALFAVLAKQWLKHYRSTAIGSARDRAHITQSRREALERWKVPTIVGLLPVLLHISLFMFFIGLAVFLYPLDQTCFRVVTAILVISLVAYITTTLLPLFFPRCSYITPVTSVAYNTMQSMHLQLTRVRSIFRALNSPWPYPSFNGHKYHLAKDLYPAKKPMQETPRMSFRDLGELEANAVKAAAGDWDIQVMVWLHSTASHQPSVSPILLQAIAALPVDYPRTLFNTLVQAEIHLCYPNRVKPWRSRLTGTEHRDPRELYDEKDQETAERYMRACVQFNARLYGSGWVWSDKDFERTYGALLFSLPCFGDAWEAMSRYENECGYVQRLCATPWRKVKQPLAWDGHHSTSRFALIFTAFLRSQAANGKAAEPMHPIIWEQLLLYVINFLSTGRDLTYEEAEFIRHSGQEIFRMMLLARHVDEGKLPIPVFATGWQFPDGDVRDFNEPGAMQQPTTLFQLPRRYYLLRFLFLSTALGSTTQQPATALPSSVFPNEADFICHLPEFYLTSLMQLLDYSAFTQTESGCHILGSEILSLVFYITEFCKGFSARSMNYTTAEAELMRSYEPATAQSWASRRRQSYITTVHYVQDNLSRFICKREYQNFSTQIQQNFIKCLSYCELYLRTVEPNGQLLSYTPTLMQHLIHSMFLILQTLKPQETSSFDTIWADHSVFYLLWRSLKDGNPSASEAFMDIDGVMAVSKGLCRASAQLGTNWDSTHVWHYAASASMVLASFIQGILGRCGLDSALFYIASPPTFAALCDSLSRLFLAHSSYRSRIGPVFLSYNVDVFWDNLILLSQMDPDRFRDGWKEVLQRGSVLVHPNHKRDYACVEEVKRTLGVSDDPHFAQFIIMKTTEVPTALEGKQQPLTPPQVGLVQVEYRLIEPYLNQHMELQSLHPIHQSASVNMELDKTEPWEEESRNNSNPGVLTRLATVKYRLKNVASRSQSPA